MVSSKMSFIRLKGRWARKCLGRGNNGLELRDHCRLEEKSVLVDDGMEEAFISHWNDKLRCMQRRLRIVDNTDYDDDTRVTQGNFRPSLCDRLRLIPY